MKASAKIVGDKLVIEIPLHDPRSSSTGKTRVVGTTGGFVATEALVDNMPVRVNVTATIPKAA